MMITHKQQKNILTRVFSNIRLLSILLCAVCLQNTLAYGQENSDAGQSDAVIVDKSVAQTNTSSESKTGQSEGQAVNNSSEADANKAIQTATAIQSEQNDDGIIRLEDTIRGNKEQPQVLTIVPWQLPVHQRINENTEWQLQVNQLTSIERSAFLRNLAVVNELKRAQKNSSKLNETSKNKE